jgi:Mn2+/Fe2+ NRAMP family transporter
VQVSILSQVINGAVLPFVLVFMILLINKRELMGEYINSRWFNAAAWGTTAVVTALTGAYLWTQFH